MYGKTLQRSRREIWSSWKVVFKRSGDDWWKRSRYCKCYVLLNTQNIILLCCKLEYKYWNAFEGHYLIIFFLTKQNKKPPWFFEFIACERVQIAFIFILLEVWGEREIFLFILIFISPVEIWGTIWMFSHLFIVTGNKNSQHAIPGVNLNWDQCIWKPVFGDSFHFNLGSCCLYNKENLYQYVKHHLSHNLNFIHITCISWITESNSFG